MLFIMAHLFHLYNPDQIIDIDRIESMRIVTSYNDVKFYCAVSCSGREYWLYEQEYNAIKRIWENKQ